MQSVTSVIDDEPELESIEEEPKVEEIGREDLSSYDEDIDEGNSRLLNQTLEKSMQKNKTQDTITRLYR
ncbi:MAG: hypothetical protein ACFFEK_13680, partial [Candidatus Thorarchaeota archaeon]